MFFAETVSDLEKRKSKRNEANEKNNTDPHSSHGPAKTNDAEKTNADGDRNNTDTGTSGNADPDAEDEQDVFEEEESKPGIFHDVYSDTESEDRFVNL